MRDLELRGAGNLLGAEQHGHMNAVGYDLYCKMLSEAVKEAKGIHTMEDFETTIDLNMDAFIPDSYISNEYQKLDIYKRIAGIETQQDYDDMLEELLDRFGECQSSSESSCDRQNESTGTPMLCGGDQTDRQGYEDYIV